MIDRVTNLAGRTRQLLGRRATLVWFLLLAILLAAFIVRERVEIGQTVRVLRQAQPLWVAGVVVLELAIIGLFGLILHLLLRGLGFAMPWRSGVKLLLFRTAVGTRTHH